MENQNTENTFDKEETLKELCKLFVKIEDEKLMYDFFGCLFTPTELTDFAKRWCLVKELNNGTTQREIAKKYNMSLCNITRGSREMKKEDSAFKKVLKILEEE